MTRDPAAATKRTTYSPYGQPSITPTAPGTHGYLNQPHDFNGDIRLDHRNYTPTLNILTTPDPLLNTLDPQNLNPYAYARNNPISGSDPTGLYCSRDPEIADPCNDRDDAPVRTGPGYQDEETSSPSEDTRPPAPEPEDEILLITNGIVPLGRCATDDCAKDRYEAGNCDEVCRFQFYGVLYNLGAIRTPPHALTLEEITALVGTAALAALGADSVSAAALPAKAGLLAGVRTCLNSFTGATLVLMADGTKRPIKDVKLGDMVMTADPVTGDRGVRTVIDLIRHGGLHTMVAVRLSGGSTIDATDRHPFWVESRGEWVDAIDLKPGDIVLTAAGDRLSVASLEISEQGVTAYNLTVADLHTYFVGESAVLVHNTRCTNIANLPASAVRNLTEDAGYAFSRLNQNHGVSRIEFREQIHMIKRNESLPADFNLSFGPTGDVWNPRTGDLIGGIVHGG